MLDINNLKVKLKDEKKVIIDGLNLNINKGEIHAIMGPNGTGKSTLAKVLLGHYMFKVTDGSIKFNNKEITKLSTDERARLGIFLSMQDPTVIDGVTLSDFLRTSLNERGEKSSLMEFINSIESSSDDLDLNKKMIHRSINKGFSGGEKKKSEILQLKVLKPKFIILDELDSGLDVDSLKIVCKNINNYLKDNKDTSVLIITHYDRILEYIKPDKVHIMVDGKIVETGDKSLAKKIESEGYKSYE